MNQRQPDAHDLVVLARALANFGVAYALIGGTAMAVHGFSFRFYIIREREGEATTVQTYG